MQLLRRLVRRTHLQKFVLGSLVLFLFRSGQIVGRLLRLRLLVEFVCDGLCLGGKGGGCLASAWSLGIIELLMAVFDRFRLSRGWVR